MRRGEAAWIEPLSAMIFALPPLSLFTPYTPPPTTSSSSTTTTTTDWDETPLRAQGRGNLCRV